MTEQQWSSAGYEAVAKLAAERTGLTFGPARRVGAEAGIRRAMKETGITDVERYRAMLQTDQRALDELVIQLTVGETYFLRDPKHFEFVRREILPDINRRRGPKHVVRAWSAGCSTGEEPYSLAFMFEEEGLGERSHILATDISRAALVSARAGRYRAWSLRHEGETLVGRYLRRVPDVEFGGDSHHYVVAPRYRKRINFEYLNLRLDPFPSLETGTWGMDLILCRNVLIHLDREAIRHVTEHLPRALAAGGWLILGPSDPLLSDSRLETVTTPSGILYRRRAESPFVLEELPQLVQEPEVPEESVEESVQALESAEAFASTKLVEPLAQEPPAPVGARPSDAGARDGDEAVSVDESLAEAEAALRRGEYARAVELVRDITGVVAAITLCVRALANIEISDAAHLCAAATARHPLSVELNHLHAMLLLGLGRYDEALGTARRVVYLDSSLAAGHFTLASILRCRADVEGAQRAYRNARDLLAVRTADELVPLCDGERAGRLAKVAAIELGMLDTSSEVMA